MKKFLFILLLFSQSGIFAQRVKAPAWEQAATPYALNDIGEEYEVRIATKNEKDSFDINSYKVQLFADMSEIGPWIKDSTQSDDLLYLRAPGAFAIDLRAGSFVYHDVTGTTSVFTEPDFIVRVVHPRSGSIYYKYVWESCHDQENNYRPYMVAELVHLWGQTCIIVSACGENPFINACSNQELSGLWDVFKPVRQIK